eukprot:3810051-Prymnesium_polylepis.2
MCIRDRIPDSRRARLLAVARVTILARRSIDSVGDAMLLRHLRQCDARPERRLRVRAQVVNPQHDGLRAAVIPHGVVVIRRLQQVQRILLPGRLHAFDRPTLERASVRDFTVDLVELLAPVAPERAHDRLELAHRVLLARAAHKTTLCIEGSVERVVDALCAKARAAVSACNATSNTSES